MKIELYDDSLRLSAIKEIKEALSKHYRKSAELELYIALRESNEHKENLH